MRTEAAAAMARSKLPQRATMLSPPQVTKRRERRAEETTSSGRGRKPVFAARIWGGGAERVQRT
jgi:hypothetical protein